MDVRERTKKAIAKTLAESGLLPEAVEDYVVSDLAGDVYSAVLAALKEAGYAVVPVEPTGHASRCGAVQLRDDRLYDEEKAEACYRAMLAAAQEHA